MQSADEEMLGYLRERSSNYTGTNYGADGVSAWALAEIERLSTALREAGARVFGGGWIDHAVDCPLGESDDSICGCGLSDWLTRNEQSLGIKLGPAVDVGAPK